MPGGVTGKVREGLPMSINSYFNSIFKLGELVNKRFDPFAKIGEYSYQQIAEFFGVHFTTVGRIVRRSLGKTSAGQQR
jgi:hypothetical protein